MKKNLLQKIYFSIIALVLFGCSNDIPMDLDNTSINSKTKAMEFTENISIKKGIMHFKNADILCSAILAPNLLDFSHLKTDNIEFKTLKNKYYKIDKSRELLLKEKENEEFSTYNDSFDNRVRSNILASFLNEDGIMIVGDSVIKVIGDYAYAANLDYYNQLLSLPSDSLINNNNIHKYRIIEPLVSDNSNIQTKGATGITYERTPVFVLTNNKKRREHVKFNPYLFVVENAQTSIVIEMEGRAQTKQIFGIWGNTFGDEMVWAEIHLNNGSWHYNQPPAGGYPVPQGTNYFAPGIKARNVGQQFCGWSQILGNTGGVSNVKASITYKVKKSEYQPSDWASEYTNNYTSIHYFGKFLPKN